VERPHAARGSVAQPVDQTIVRDGSRAGSNGLSLDAEGLLLDFSRQRLDARALELLLGLAEQTEVAALDRTDVRRSPDQQHRGPPGASRRAAPRGRSPPHRLWRRRDAARRKPSGARCARSAEALHAGKLLGYTGKPITDIVKHRPSAASDSRHRHGGARPLAEGREARVERCTSCRTSTGWRSRTC